MYKRVDLEEGTQVQYLATYILNWQQSWEKPLAGFVEIDYTLDDAMLDLSGVQLIDNTGEEADMARVKIEEIFRKLAGE